MRNSEAPGRRTRWTAALAICVIGVGVGLVALRVTDGDTHSKDAPSNPSSRTGATQSPTSTTTPRRPNLMMIMVDDMRSDELAWMPHVRSWLQDDGVEFRNSFSPYPLCCPARASFLSGQLAHNHGVLSHNPPYGFNVFDDRSTLATSLQQAGYRTMFVGKYLNGYGYMRTHETEQPSAGYVPPGWDTWTAGVELPLPASNPLSGSTYAYFDMTENINGAVVPNQGIYSTNLLGKQARDDLADAPSSEPWFMYLSLVAPHPGTPVEPDDPAPRTLIGEKGVRLPGEYLTPGRPDWVKGIVDSHVAQAPGVPLTGQPEENMADKPFFLRSWPPLDAVDRAGLLTMTRQRAESLVVADLEIGQTLQQLRAQGILDDTIVMFTSDNGYYLGEHRQREKIKTHEPSLRVPLLMRIAGVAPGVRYDPATTVDLTATLLDLAGATPPHEPDGMSLTPIIESGDRGWKRPVVTENLIPRVTPRSSNEGWSKLSSVGLRLPRYSFTRYANGAVEFYDLFRDPNQLVNLHGRSDVRTVEGRVDAFWRQEIGCSGPTCLRRLPPGLDADATLNRRITDHEEAARTARFGRFDPLTREEVLTWLHK